MRKFTLPTPLRHLTDDQLAELHAWFKRHTYPQILAHLRDRFGVEMSKTQLCRYHQKFAEAQVFNAALHNPLTPADMLALKTAQPVPALDERATRDALMYQCLRLARRPDVTPLELVQLQEVVTYYQRRELAESEQELQIRKMEHRERIEQFRRARRFRQPTHTG